MCVCLCVCVCVCVCVCACLYYYLGNKTWQHTHGMGNKILVGNKNLDPTREIIEMDRGDVADMTSAKIWMKKNNPTLHKNLQMCVWVCLRLALYRLKRVLQVHFFALKTHTPHTPSTNQTLTCLSRERITSSTNQTLTYLHVRSSTLAGDEKRHTSTKSQDKGRLIRRYVQF